MSDRRSVRLAAAISSILSAPAMIAGAALVTTLAIVPAAMAQETSTQMNGYVVDQSGNPVAGAQVTILHVPSGTTSSATTGTSGSFAATGLRIGGPYRVTAKAEGQQDAVVEDVYTQLGQRASITVVSQSITQLAGVEVTGSSDRDTSIGSGSKFNANDVRALPSISRDIKDIVRIDPKISLDPNNFDAMEVAGVNNRYNSITVDGVRQSDDFGLNNSGYPTQRAPISVDAIQAVSVQTAPFNVEYSHFRGSTINVVTKSGTNEFSGSAYYYNTDDSLVGDETKGRPLSFTFDETTYGATFGGPIIKDKLFFFASYEKLDRESPQDFGPTGSGFPVEIPGVSQADYDQIVAHHPHYLRLRPGRFAQRHPGRGREGAGEAGLEHQRQPSCLARLAAHRGQPDQHDQHELLASHHCHAVGPVQPCDCNGFLLAAAVLGLERHLLDRAQVRPQGNRDPAGLAERHGFRRVPGHAPAVAVWCLRRSG